MLAHDGHVGRKGHLIVHDNAGRRGTQHITLRWLGTHVHRPSWPSRFETFPCSKLRSCLQCVPCALWFVWLPHNRHSFCKAISRLRAFHLIRVAQLSPHIVQWLHDTLHYWLSKWPMFLCNIHYEVQYWPLCATMSHLVLGSKYQSRLKTIVSTRPFHKEPQWHWDWCWVRHQAVRTQHQCVRPLFALWLPKRVHQTFVVCRMTMW